MAESTSYCNSSLKIEEFIFSDKRFQNFWCQMYLSNLTIYLKKYGKLPIEDGVDVIAVGNLSFLRFLEIAKYLTIQVTVVTDNDGNIDALNEKYKEYKDLPNICICFDDTIDAGDLRIGDKPFNYNTMEPKL